MYLMLAYIRYMSIIKTIKEVWCVHHEGNLKPDAILT